MIHDYADLFNDEVGSLPVTYHMKLDWNVTFVIRPPRRIPVALMDKVKTELQIMVKSGVITPISEPTEWVSSMVATHKKDTDNIQLCIDLRDLPHWSSVWSPPAVILWCAQTGHSHMWAVLPQMLHKEYLTLPHKGHPGAEATKRRACNVVFWTTMTTDIDNFVQ